MRRFLIFIGLLPGIAVALLIALVSIEAGALPDIRTAADLAAWGYAVGVIPALICAVVDLQLRKTRIPAVIGTALVGYAIAALVASTIFERSDLGMGLAMGMIPVVARLTPVDLGIATLYLAFGFAGAIPAAVCSLLSGTIMQVEPDGLMPRAGEAR